ncbi:hypothetical protein BD779DRAFT_1785146 [Infundibulicybe gibba]|nr:hypothetical protein BD779DRAFT_1785146 [Infundibulicybe gibba]
MFAKLSLLALVAPLVSALTINAPTDPTSGGSVTITWTTTSGDPPIFSIELMNTAFNNAFAIANNVDVSLGTITLTLPIVPVGAGYTITAVDVSNIANVFSTTGSFSVGAITSASTTTAQSTTTTGTGTTTATSATAPTLSTATTARPTTTTRSVSIASGTGTGSGTGAGSGYRHWDWCRC